MAIRMQVTPVFSKNQHCYNDESKRYIVNSGGSRSSKTYSILQLFSLILMEKENYQIKNNYCMTVMQIFVTINPFTWGTSDSFYSSFHVFFSMTTKCRYAVVYCSMF